MAKKRGKPLARRPAELTGPPSTSTLLADLRDLIAGTRSAVAQPPGRDCVASDADTVALATYLEAVQQAQSLNRTTVRESAAATFDAVTIIDTIVDALTRLRHR